jgi:hypothetical protein
MITLETIGTPAVSAKDVGIKGNAETTPWSPSPSVCISPRHGLFSAVGLHLGSHDYVVCSPPNAGHPPLNECDGYADAGVVRIEQEFGSTVGLSHLGLAEEGKHLVLRHADFDIGNVCRAAVGGGAASQMRQHNPKHDIARTEHRRTHPPGAPQPPARGRLCHR